MGLKILHTADWHLDSPFTALSPEQRLSLLKAQRALPEKIAQVCRREGCDLMVLAGDIFDGEASRDTLDRLKAALKECSVPVIITPGNHDFCAPGSPWEDTGWPENVCIFTGELDCVTLTDLDCRIYGAAYRSMDCPGLLEDFHTEGEERYQIAVLHGDAVTPNSPYCPITAAQVRDSGLDYVALGHVHKMGAFRAGNTLCAWPGCPMGRGWDECGEKGVLIVELSDSASIRALPLDTLRFEDLTVDVGDDAVNALEHILPGAESPHFYRVTLTGTGEANIPGLKRRFPHIPNLELRDHTQPPLDLWADVGSDTLEGTFFRFLKEGMEDNPQHAELFRQAAEISRKLLEGREVTLP